MRPYLALEDIQYLFTRFAAIFGYVFTSQYQDVYNELENDWLEGLKNLTRQQIERGIRYCRDQRAEKYPPSVSEFRRCCFPSLQELGIPEPEEAYRLALENNWQHPVIWFAVDRCGYYEFKSQPERKIKPVFLEHYKSLVDEAVYGGRVFTIPKKPELKQLTVQESAPSSPETAKNYLAQCREILNKNNQIRYNERKVV